MSATETPPALSEPESSESRIASVMSPTLPTTQEGSPSLPSLPLFDPTVGWLSLELLHHYTISTCYTLSRSPAVQAVWRDEAPRIGFSAAPVMHALLALSALHIARSDESRRVKYQELAKAHHNAALEQIVPMVATLAEKNGAALFMFSTLTCLYSCAKPQEEDHFLVLFERGNLSNWAQFFRGTKTIIESGGDDLKNGKLAPIFLNGSFISAAHKSPESLEQGTPYVWELKEMVQKKCSKDPGLLRVYGEVLDELARTLAVTMKPDSKGRLETADVFRWLLDIPDDYLNLLLREEPIALIIFAYWCVAIRQIEWMWWMEGLSSRLLSQLSSVLDTGSRVWLLWPDQIINAD